jgi:hypothetical protein
VDQHLGVEVIGPTELEAAVQGIPLEHSIVEEIEPCAHVERTRPAQPKRERDGERGSQRYELGLAEDERRAHGENRDGTVGKEPTVASRL